MKKMLKTALAFLSRIIALLLFGAIIVTGYFAYGGYKMYSAAMAEKSVAEMAEDIKSRCDFRGYNELPQFYVNAVVSTEDRRFFTHGGIDISAICRAVLHDVRVKAPEQGGSTITQQLAKNEFFTQDKKLERKFAEIFMAFKIESELSKEDIFALYVNSIYFGGGNYGIFAAAEGICGKDISELTEYECALLAGLPNAPSVYAPNSELSERRTEIVLENMSECGYITEENMRNILSRSKNNVIS